MIDILNIAYASAENAVDADIMDFLLKAVFYGLVIGLVGAVFANSFFKKN